MRQTNTLLPNIRRIVKLYESMLRPICDKYRLAPIEATIISFLQNNSGRDTAADIVELRMLSKSNVSQAVESLIQKSMLERRQDTRDRRRIHLSLTTEARPITDDIETVRETFRKQIFRGFSAEEQQQFVWFNERIAENIKTAAERQYRGILGEKDFSEKQSYGMTEKTAETVSEKSVLLHAAKGEKHD